MNSPFRRASAVLFVVAVAGAAACSDRRVEDETPGRVSPAQDTLGMQDTLDMQDTLGADTAGMGADTADVDMNPPGGANPGQSGTGADASEGAGTGAPADVADGGGTTVNFEEGVATDASGAETKIGGVTSGNVTIREGAAAEGGEAAGGTSADDDTAADQ